MGNLSLSQDIYDGRPAVNLNMGCSLDLQTADALAELLREAVNAGQSVVIDATSVERVSTSAVQLLLATDRALAAAGCTLALSNPSDPFLAAFAECGIQPDEMSWTIVSERSDG